MRRALVVVLAIGLGACGKRATWETRRIGGVTISLPAGHDDAVRTPAVGALRVVPAADPSAAAGVVWMAGGLPAPTDDVELSFRIVASLIDAIPAGAPSQDFPLTREAPHVTIAARLRGEPGFLTMFECGKVAYLVYAFGADARAWQQRAMASVTCETGPGDADHVDVPLVISVPAGWRRVMEGPDGYAYTDGREEIFVSAAPLLSHPGTIDRFLGTLADTTGTFTAEGAPRDDGDHRVVRGTAMRSEGRSAVRAVAWPCADAGITIALVAVVPPGGDVGAMEARLHAARCARPGEAATR